MLTGKTNEERIWNYLTAAGLTACGAAGLMGNLYAESGLIPANLQNTYEKKLGYTDAAYTAAVDGGAYTSVSCTLNSIMTASFIIPPSEAKPGVAISSPFAIILRGSNITSYLPKPLSLLEVMLYLSASSTISPSTKP